MYPYLIDFGEVSLPFVGEVWLRLPTYGVLVATAFLVGWVWFVRNAAREGIDPQDSSSVAFWTLISGLVGGKLGLVLVSWRAYLDEPSLLLSFDFWRSAGVVWTALLFGMLGLVVSAKLFKLPLGRVLDAMALPVPLGQAIGRLGCLAAGCCYGSACSLPWAITYPRNPDTEVIAGVPLHPAPLYEALWSVTVVIPILWIRRARGRRFTGELALLYLMLYSVGRFFVEFFRGDTYRGVWFDGSLSTSQIISLLVAPAALVCWVILSRRKVSSGDVVTNEMVSDEVLPADEESS